MKKFLSVLLVLSLLLTAAVCMTACNNTDGYTYVSLKINPDVDFIIDADGKVVSYSCNNTDAEVLLSNSELKGMTIEAATETVLALAVEAGYVDAETEGDSIELGVINSNGETDEETFGKIKDNLEHYFENNGIFGKVSQATLDTYLEEAEKLGVSVGRVKILMLACDRLGLTLEEANEKSNGQLMKLINSGNGKKMRKRGNQSDKQNAMQQKCENNKTKLQNHNDKFMNGDVKQIKAQIRAWQDGETEG